MRLSLTLTLFYLTVRCSGQTALLLYFFSKDGSGVPANCSLCGTEATLTFSAVQVFPLKSGPFCKLFAGVGNTNKFATSLVLLSDSRSVLITVCNLAFSLSPQTLWQKPSSLSLFEIRLQWVPGLSFLLENNKADELAKRRCFSNWRLTISSKFLDTHVPSVSIEERVLH